MCINVTYINYYPVQKQTNAFRHFPLCLSVFGVYASFCVHVIVCMCIDVLIFWILQNAEYTYVYIDSLRSPLLEPVIVDVCYGFFFLAGFDRSMNALCAEIYTKPFLNRCEAISYHIGIEKLVYFGPGSSILKLTNGISTSNKIDWKSAVQPK